MPPMNVVYKLSGKRLLVSTSNKLLKDINDVWNENISINRNDLITLLFREKVKNFAQLSASGTRPDGKPCPAFKIIILDEADSMTKDAQSALR